MSGLAVRLSVVGMGAVPVGGNGLVVVKCGLWCGSCGDSGLRNWVSHSARWRPGVANWSAGSVRWWCEWNVNWVLVHSSGDTVVARAGLS